LDVVSEIFLTLEEILMLWERSSKL